MRMSRPALRREHAARHILRGALCKITKDVIDAKGSFLLRALRRIAPSLFTWSDVPPVLVWDLHDYRI